jgi:predicted dehydrogenase
MEDAVKIGLIGCGRIARQHVNGYLKLSNASVTAVCDSVEDNARFLAQQVGGAQPFTHWDTMLAESDIDAVDICLPHHLHTEAILASARKGKHILCEKPLCLNMDEAQIIRQVVKENGITLMCAHNHLFFPAIRQARQVLEDQILGQIYEIRVTDSFYYASTTETIGWRKYRSMSGGGELIDTGYHSAYLLLYLADSSPVEIAAMLTNHRLHFIEGEDSAQVLVRLANGIVGSIVTSWAYEPSANTEKFSVVGERGSMYGNGQTLRYKLRGSEPVTIEGKQKKSTFDEEIADFVACFHENRTPIHTVDDGINALKIILGAYRSAQERKIVAL